MSEGRKVRVIKEINLGRYHLIENDEGDITIVNSELNKKDKEVDITLTYGEIDET